MSNQQIDPCRVALDRVRLSFVHLLTPRVPLKGGEPKFQATILLPKTDVSGKARIDMAIQAAIQAGISAKWGGIAPARPEIGIYDGDGVRLSGEAFGPECKGHWVFTASGTRKPEIIDLNFNPILDASQIYSGMYAQISFRFFAYAANGKKGIGCGIGNVRKIGDGEPLAATGPSAADEFGGSAAPAAYQQPACQPQPQGYYAQPAAPTYQAPVYQQPVQPAYQMQPQPQQQPAYPSQPQQQPTYPQQPAAPTYQQPQPYYPQPTMPIDPITGRPSTGGVMGL